MHATTAKVAGTLRVPSARRRGFTLVELIVALTILGVLAASVVPTLRWVNLERRESQRRIVAQQEAGNALERIAALPWNQVANDTTKSWELSPQGAAALPDGRLEVAILDQPDAVPPARKVRVSVSWAAGKRHTETVRVVAWVHSPAEARP